jgi:hypothetical protein
MSKCLIGGVFRDGYDPYHLNRIKCTKAEKIDTMAFWLWREKNVDYEPFSLLRRFAYYGKNVGLTRRERREAADKSLNPESRGIA